MQNFDPEGNRLQSKIHDKFLNNSYVAYSLVVMQLSNIYFTGDVSEAVFDQSSKINLGVTRNKIN